MEYRPTGTAPPGTNPRNSLALRMFRLDICLWADVAALLRGAGFTYPTNPARAGNGKLEGAAYAPARGASPALLAVLNDNDFGRFVPIPEQLDVVEAPPLCTAG